VPKRPEQAWQIPQWKSLGDPGFDAAATAPVFFSEECEECFRFAMVNVPNSFVTNDPPSHLPQTVAQIDIFGRDQILAKAAYSFKGIAADK
jgi:hypothetical protein